MEDERKLLNEILIVLEQRAVGHIIMYSDRVAHFVPEIRKVLKKSEEISKKALTNPKQ